MKVAMALAVLLFASVAQAQTVVTANPTAIDFGTLYPTDFDTQTIVYTCVTGPCVGAAPKITGGHNILVSGNSCKASWTYFEPGQTGDTCSVSWTLKATNAEVNCPENVCTGTVGISVTNGVSNDAILVSDGYTATVLSAKPIVTISPKSLDFGDQPLDEDFAGPYPVTVTNISEVTIELTYEVINAYGSDFYVGHLASPVTLTPGQSVDLSVFENLLANNCNTIPCTVHFSGTLKIWSASVTPGTPGTTYLQGHVSLVGEGFYTEGVASE